MVKWFKTNHHISNFRTDLSYYSEVKIIMKRINKETLEMLVKKDIARQITPFNIYLIGEKSVYGLIDGSYKKIYELGEYDKETLKK